MEWLERSFELDLEEIKVVILRGTENVQVEMVYLWPILDSLGYFEKDFDEGFQEFFFVMVWSMQSGIPIFFVSLSQKKTNSRKTSEFQPISLGSSLYKIMAEVLENRLNEV